VIEHQTGRIERRLKNNFANSPDARYILECTRAISFLIDVFQVGLFMLADL
jgi:hypothetical protein